MILVIGNLMTWEREGRPVPKLEGFYFASFSEIDARLLSDVKPDVVLSALMGESFDVIDLACRLVELGFAGRYRALTTALPNAEAVRNEVQAIAPSLDFNFYVIGSTLDPPA
ncbi:hypothetical protein FHG66_06345 [Rubellimicrobium rubrum]|uniref:Uncharacterized protein n=1 Tax=Rubellimicrobium rubrum TaxID=2585369 RepID=A0A5C4N2Z2_9RHOB|nr:hypothetical protein [Rubellimicrobium rubrum]TNC51163.1 hypothetical protein FHG66_06345 [Rubellimicrobium rubrum]